MMFEIRAAKPSDVDGIYEVCLEMIEAEDEASRRASERLLDTRRRRSDFERSAKEELVRELSEERSRFLIALLDDRIVGYARGTLLEDPDPFFETIRIGYFNALAVLGSHRGRGIASQLRRALESWFEEKGCSQIQLDVFDQNPAMALYEHWGYTRYNVRMVKEL